MIKNPKTETRKECKTIVSHDSLSFNYLNPRSGGFFYREGMITGYNSPFPSSKNSRFKNGAKGTVKRAIHNKLLQNESESDATRFIAYKSNLSCSKYDSVLQVA